MISVQCNTEFMHCMNEIITVKMKTIVHDDDNDKFCFLILGFLLDQTSFKKASIHFHFLLLHHILYSWVFLSISNL